MKVKKILFSLIVISSMLISGCGSIDNNSGGADDISNDGESVRIAATIYPLADIVKNIGRDNVNVINILPAGASPHTFEIKPSDVKNISDVELVFAIGQGLDNWTNDLINAVPDVDIYTVEKNIDLLEMKHVHNHGDDNKDEGHQEDKDEHNEGNAEYNDEEGKSNHNKDPHYWLSADNAKIIARNVTDKLSEIDPENASIYERNYSEYIEKLDIAKNAINEKFSSLDDAELIVFHESWNYFARDFGLDIAGVFEARPGVEPSAKSLKELYDIAEEHDIKVVFSEPQFANSTIKPFVEDNDMKLFVLDPLGGVDGRDSLIKLLEYNSDTIYEAFE